jgi:hypothetical protein
MILGKLAKWHANRNKAKCDICDGTKGTVLREEKGFLGWTYHQECLKNVVCDPEEYPDWIGYAYTLTKIIESRKDTEKRELEALKRLQPKYECKETR